MKNYALGFLLLLFFFIGSYILLDKYLEVEEKKFEIEIACKKTATEIISVYAQLIETYDKVDGVSRLYDSIQEECLHGIKCSIDEKRAFDTMIKLISEKYKYCTGEYKK